MQQIWDTCTFNCAPCTQCDTNNNNKNSPRTDAHEVDSSKQIANWHSAPEDYGQQEEDAQSWEQQRERSRDATDQEIASAPPQLVIDTNIANDPGSPSNSNAIVDGSPSKSGSKSGGSKKQRWLEEHDVLTQTKWCFYCILCGCGTLEVPAELRCLLKQICCAQVCEGADPTHAKKDGCCHMEHTCCCCTGLCQLPFRSNSPKCICCNFHLCGNHPEVEEAEDEDAHIRNSHQEPTRHMYEFILYEQKVPCYCCCCGCGGDLVFLAPYQGMTKCGSMKHRTELGTPCDDAGCCGHLCSCGRLQLQMRIPPEVKYNPICACCGWRFKKPKGIKKPGNASPSSPSKGAQSPPSQQRM